MPTIEVSKIDLCNLIGKKLSLKEIEDDLLLVKGELESVEGDKLKIEIADTNRPELWSAEGVAREIRTKYGKPSPSFGEVKPSGVVVNVDKNLKNIRPLTVCAVIRKISFTPEVMSQMIQLQEKICETFGSKRKEAAIGVYDLHKITPPITYKGFKPDELKFQPLEMSKKLNLSQILHMHPKGKEYGSLLEGFERYPIFIDEAGEVLSMPPIINSDHTGKVGENTKDVFIECSGFLMKYIMPALNAVVSAMVDRKGVLESVEVVYPDKKIITPNLKPKKISLELDYIEKRMGLNIGKKKIIKLLKEANYSIAKEKNKVLELEYPAYRQDIMHPADVAEDVIIRYGYNNIEPRNPEMITKKSMLPIHKLTKEVANMTIGLGAQEVLSYTLTNEDNHVTKMNLNDVNFIEVENPVSSNWAVFRTWIIPCLMELLGRNTNKEYPQQLFEIGEVVMLDTSAETKTKNPTRIGWVKADKTADFTEAKQALDFLLRNLGLKYKIEETTHDSFLKGRVGRAYIGTKAVAYLGEINPEVLKNFGIEMPVCAFELNLSEILEVL